MNCNVEFSSNWAADAGTFKLLELPQDLCELISRSLESSEPTSLTIKGSPGEEDAVLTTNNATYSMRSVVLSNSVLVLSAPPDADFVDDRAIIRDQVNEIIELTPAVPKLHKLSALLRGREYNELEGTENEEDQSLVSGFTYTDAQDIIQASDAELDRGLRDKHILNINNELRQIASEYLQNILELFLTLLVSQTRSLDAVPVEPLVSSLANNHEIPRTVSLQVMSWFGELAEGRWKTDIPGIVKEVGLCLLRSHKLESVAVEDLVASWKGIVGDSFQSSVSLKLLLGNYLASDSEPNRIVYFPSSGLPAEPAARFNDLFLTRPRWKHEDIVAFLADIAINLKERDKLLLKYTRTTSESTGVWYTARVQYSG